MGSRVMSTIQAPGEGYLFDRRVISWSWRRDAACGKTVLQADGTLQVDRDVAEGFFPTGVTDLATEAAAKRVCGRCPVLGECLADALLARHAHETGVRGGMTATERADLSDHEREVLIAPYATPAPETEE